MARTGWVSLWGRRAVALGGLALLAGACERSLPTDGAGATVSLRITAVTAGTSISTLVVQVTAADIPTPLVFNLTVVNGVASGTIKIPPGPARTIDVTAMDAQGTVTHEGSATLDVHPGQNPPLQIKLGPRSGHVPITVTFGNFGVVVTPATATIDVLVAATLQLTVTVTDVDGQVIAAPDVGWATTNPAVATVSASGLVTGVTNGLATIVATYEGVAGLSAITVTGAGGVSFASVSAGQLHTCGVATSGVLYCWGRNSNGQLGDGTTTDRQRPEPVAGGLAFASVDAGDLHTCGVTTSGALYCWGQNTFGQLGGGTTLDRLSPELVTGGLTFATVTVGMDHTCGLTATGTAYCWGANFTGALGDGTTTTRRVPGEVAGGLSFVSLSAGNGYTCGATTAGAGYCWGNDATNQLGDESVTNRLTPVLVHGGLTFTSLTASRHGFTCGLTPDGKAYCWGFNGAGSIGDGTKNTLRRSPTAVVMPADIAFARLDAGGLHVCGLDPLPGGAGFCWGANAGGQLGDGTATEQLIPVAVGGGLSFAMVSAGEFHTCALTPAGAAYCWGNNGFGQLGDGTTTARSTPTVVTP